MDLRSDASTGPAAPGHPTPLCFLPGPTALHPLAVEEARKAFADGFLSRSHRSPGFRAYMHAMEEGLRSLLRIPVDHRILLVGSATEAMERIIQGVVANRSAHLVNGAFARRFRQVAVNLGRKAAAVTVPDGEGFLGDEEGFPEHGQRFPEHGQGFPEHGQGFPKHGQRVPKGGEGLRAQQAGLTPSGVDTLLEGAELLAMTQNETSTGVRIPTEAVHSLADRARNSGALAVVDLVTGWPSEPVDPARIDCGFFSVQKAFGLPAGLGVMVVSPEFVERSRNLEAGGHITGGYMGIPALAEVADRHETRATPNMLAIRLLARVAEAYALEGQEALDSGVRRRAEAFWSVVEGLPGLTAAVGPGDNRSRTILVVEVEGGSRPLRERLAERGLLVGDGYGPGKGRHLRIANFPVQTDEMMDQLLEGLAAEV